MVKAMLARLIDPSAPLRWLTVMAAAFLPALPVSSQPQEAEQTSAPPAYELGPRRIRALYLDLLGRPPRQSERDTWGGKGMRVWLDEHLGAVEFWENWLEEELYYFLLIDNFRPGAPRVLGMPEELDARRLGVRDALQRIVVCASFDRRNPGPDTFVTVVMEQLLGVTVQDMKRELDVGKSLYDGGKGRFLGRQGQSQADVVRIAIEDRRTLRHFLTRQHERLLREPPPKRELGRWALALEKDPDAYLGLLRDWLLSDAYNRRLEGRAPLSNRSFVRALFIDLVDRLPDEEESRRLRNALDGLGDARPLRAVLARLLLDSGTAPLPKKDAIVDPTSWVAGLFERFLGRTATEAELAAFVSAFHEPECQPSTVVYAIVSHPEYQTW